MSPLAEIDRAVALVNDAGVSLTVMQCTSISVSAEAGLI
jgi:hypothetical protein